MHVCARILLYISGSDSRILNFLAQDLAGTSGAEQNLLNRLRRQIPRKF